MKKYLKSGFNTTQNIKLEAGTYSLVAYVKSLYGNTYTFALGYDGAQGVEWTEYDIDVVKNQLCKVWFTFTIREKITKLKPISSNFSASLPVYVADLQLTRGNVPVEAGASPLDVDEILNETLAKTKFMTEIDGGLIYSAMMKLYDAGGTGDEMAGISGIAGDNKEDPAFWAGGTYEQAIGGTAKALIRHDGFAKFEYGKIADFDIIKNQLTANGAGISGFKGESGKNITYIFTYYSSAVDSINPPTKWQTTMPNLLSGHYLWKYERIMYTGGSFYNSKPVIIAFPSTPAILGNPIHYFLISDNSFGITTDTSGWQTGTPLTVIEGQHLWSYTSLSHLGEQPNTIAGPFNISPIKPAFWAGGSYDDAVKGDAKTIIRHDGSAKFRDADIEGRVNVIQSDGSRVLVDGSGLSIFNALGNMNIRFGIKDGYAVMEYFDNDGNFLYDLGPNGITALRVREESWTPVKLVYLGTSFSNVLTNPTVRTKMRTSSQQTESTFQRYIAKIVGGVKDDPDNNDGKLFNTYTLSSGFINNGVYMKKTGDSNLMYITNNTGVRIYPPGIQADNEAVYDIAPIYSVQMIQYFNGVVIATANAYWNG